MKQNKKERYVLKEGDQQPIEFKTGSKGNVIGRICGVIAILDQECPLSTFVKPKDVIVCSVKFVFPTFYIVTPIKEYVKKKE